MKIETILKKIEKIYPNPQIELYYETPFQLLIAVVLSAQTTDKQVNKVTKDYAFFDKVKKPEDIIKLWFDWVRQWIKTIWLTNSKAKNIYNLSKQILAIKEPISKDEKQIFEKYFYIIPDSLDRIMKLSWVWEKTWKVVLSVLYKKALIPVDTHVHRVANRLWIVNTNYEIQTSKQLESIIPDKLKNKAHHLFIHFWRYFCLARSPKCYDCPLKFSCKYFKK